MPADYSVLIVTYNSSDEIIPCLDSLFYSDGAAFPFEVIIVDNASSDGTVDVIHKKYSDVHVIQNKKNIGFGAAINQGAAQANGTYLVILNPDTVVHTGFLQRVSEFFQGQPDAGIVGCNIINESGKHLPSCWRDPSLRTIFYEVFLPYSTTLPLVTENPTTTKQVDMVSGACMSVRRDVFQQLTGFDTRFFMYYEDADLCLRARRAGHHVYYHPAVSVYHRVGASTTDMALFYQRVWKNKMLFLKKHRPAWYYVASHTIVFVGLSIRILAYLLVGGVAFNKTLLRLAKYYTLALAKIVGGN